MYVVPLELPIENLLSKENHVGLTVYNGILLDEI